MTPAKQSVTKPLTTNASRRETDSSVPTPSAPVQEVFSSIQGEGVYVGKRQIFVRFAHCHLKCAYCDTPMTSATGQCFVETVPGQSKGQGHNYQEILENPLNVEALWAVIQQLWPLAKHHSISFTGGEPLLYHRLLADLFPILQANHMPTYLETSGTQPEFLEPVLAQISIIAMDIKLPSSTQEPPQFSNHQAFYDLAITNPNTELFIKLVFNDKTSPEEFSAVAEIVKNRKTPIILQPQTSLETRQVVTQPHVILAAENFLSQYFDDVRVIPQTHKMLNVL